MLSKTESTGVVIIENDDQRYSQIVSESRVRNINGRAMLRDSSVSPPKGQILNEFSMLKVTKKLMKFFTQR